MRCVTIIRCANCGEERVFDGDMTCLFCNQGTGFDEYKAIVFERDEEEVLRRCLEVK